MAANIPAEKEWEEVHQKRVSTRLPARCVCDSNVTFSVEHALSCKKGGFINIRHNDIRDYTAEILSEIWGMFGKF